MRLVLICLLLASQLLSKMLQVEVEAASAIVINADTGAVLFEKNARLPSHPASTTKISTALYCLDHQIPLDSLYKVSKEALSHKEKKEHPNPWELEQAGTMMYIRPGEKLTLESLLYGLLLISGNDAANVIAENVSGSIPQFMEDLNHYLTSIGCENTSFTNPHGLTDSGHQTTAYDLARMTQKALQFPAFKKIVSTVKYQRPKTNQQPEKEMISFNRLLKEESQYYYPKAFGVKTGYTEAAKYSLVAAAEDRGRCLIAVLLGCPSKHGHFQDAKKLFHAAFSEKKVHRKLIGSERVFVKKIKGFSAEIKASLATPLSIQTFPSEDPRCKAVLHWSYSLPIRKGQKVGEIQILGEQEDLLAKGDLISLEKVSLSFFSILKYKLLGVLFPKTELGEDRR